MTLQEIIDCDKDVLIPSDIAETLGTHPYTISIEARDNPERLGFPVIRLGKFTKIPRLAFLRYMGVEI